MGIKDWFNQTDVLEPGTDSYEQAAELLTQQVNYDKLTDMRREYQNSIGPKIDDKGLAYVQLRNDSQTVYVPIAEYSNGTWDFVNDELTTR